MAETKLQYGEYLTSAKEVNREHLKQSKEINKELPEDSACNPLATGERRRESQILTFHIFTHISCVNLCGGDNA
jgi:hypothetical protein